MNDQDRPQFDQASPGDALQEASRPAETKARESVILNRIDAGLRAVKIAVGWTAPEKTGSYDLDMDVCLFILNRQNRVRFDTDFVFYNNLSAENDAVRHKGDDETGRAPGDNEVIEAELNKLAFDAEKLVMTLSIHNADERDQNFGHIQAGYIRLENLETGQEVARFDLREYDPKSRAFKFAELVRNDEGGWTFNLLLESHPQGLYGIARDYGVNVAEP